jgi:hypothetical protein
MDCSAERSVAVTTKSFPTMPSSVSIACVYVCVYGGGGVGVCVSLRKRRDRRRPSRHTE